MLAIVKSQLVLTLSSNQRDFWLNGRVVLSDDALITRLDKACLFSFDLSIKSVYDGSGNSCSSWDWISGCCTVLPRLVFVFPLRWFVFTLHQCEAGQGGGLARLFLHLTSLLQMFWLHFALWDSITTTTTKWVAGKVGAVRRWHASSFRQTWTFCPTVKTALNNAVTPCSPHWPAIFWRLLPSRTCQGYLFRSLGRFTSWRRSLLTCFAPQCSCSVHKCLI